MLAYLNKGSVNDSYKSMRKMDLTSYITSVSTHCACEQYTKVLWFFLGHTGTFHNEHIPSLVVRMGILMSKNKPNTTSLSSSRTTLMKLSEIQWKIGSLSFYN